MGRERDGDWEMVKCVREGRWEKRRARTGRECNGRWIRDRLVRASVVERAA